MPRRRAHASLRRHLANELLGDRRGNRDAKTARNHAVDADHFTIECRERAAGVARCQADVGADELVVAVRHGMHDADAERATNAVRMSERYNQFADSEATHVAHPRRRRPLIRWLDDRESGEITLAIARDHPRLDFDTARGL